MSVYFTIQRIRAIKNVLHETLFENLTKKYIVYTNTAYCFDQMQSDIELWLGMNNDIKCDALVISGALKPEVKFASAERFTRVVDDPEELLNKNGFFLRILLSTAGSIGAGLKSPDCFCSLSLWADIFST